MEASRNLKKIIVFLIYLFIYLFILISWNWPRENPGNYYSGPWATHRPNSSLLPPPPPPSSPLFCVQHRPQQHASCIAVKRIESRSLIGCPRNRDPSCRRDGQTRFVPEKTCGEARGTWQLVRLASRPWACKGYCMLLSSKRLNSSLAFWQTADHLAPNSARWPHFPAASFKLTLGCANKCICWRIRFAMHARVSCCVLRAGLYIPAFFVSTRWTPPNKWQGAPLDFSLKDTRVASFETGPSVPTTRSKKWLTSSKLTFELEFRETVPRPKFEHP